MYLSDFIFAVRGTSFIPFSSIGRWFNKSFYLSFEFSSTTTTPCVCVCMCVCVYVCVCVCAWRARDELYKLDYSKLVCLLLWDRLVPIDFKVSLDTSKYHMILEVSRFKVSCDTWSVT